MEIRHHQIDGAEAIARRDENRGFAGEWMQLAILARGAFQEPQRGRSHSDDPPAICARRVESGSRLGANFTPLGMHPVVGRIVRLHRQECARTDMQRDLVQADRLDRVVEVNLVAADVEAFGSERLDDVASSNRAVELAGFASGADDDEGLAVELFGNRLGFRLALEVTGFERRTLGFETGLVGSVGAQCLAERQEIVAGKAVANLYGFAHLAELGDAFKKNDVHCLVLSGCSGVCLVCG